MKRSSAGDKKKEGKKNRPGTEEKAIFVVRAKGDRPPRRTDFSPTTARVEEDEAKRERVALNISYKMGELSFAGFVESEQENKSKKRKKVFK